MELSQTLRENERIAHSLFAVGLSMFALLSFRKGKRLRGVLAGLGAIGLGYRASTKSGDKVTRPTDGSGIESTAEDELLRCAICGEPIVAGQSRVPNENDETVHEACLEAPA